MLLNVIDQTGTLQVDRDSPDWLGDLNSDSIKVDERDMAQRLEFAADYGSLINYYDHQNRQNGHWRDFYLKDPMILMAVISRTDYHSIHQQTALIGQKLTSLLAGKKADQTTASTIYHLINRVCELVGQLFLAINEWLIQIFKDPQSYALKTFITEKVKSEISPLLRQQVAQQTLLSRQFQGIFPPESIRYKTFSPCWQFDSGSADLCPPLQIKQVHINTALNHTNLSQINMGYEAIDEIYQRSFSFFVQVIDNAKAVYALKSEQGNHFPDTALLIAFVKLMEVQKQQLNDVTARHLDFYYQDILKQTLGLAKADQVYLLLTLAQKYSTFDLPANTAFPAGLDANKKPVVFKTLTSQQLTQTKIRKAVTLFYQPKKGLQYQPIANPGQLKETLQGEPVGWSLFGQPTPSAEQSVQPVMMRHGFSLASPLLYLQNGNRWIDITLTFSENVLTSLFDEVNYYFSSEKKWLSPAKAPKIISNNSKQQITLKFLFKQGEPSICAFIKNPDGYQSQWPLFKMLLPTTYDLTLKPASLVSVGIAITVTDFNDVQCHSKTSILPETNFKPFGAIVNSGDSFYIGSAEMFAKPLTQLELTLNWNNLPWDFEDYYSAYNTYIENHPLEWFNPSHPFVSINPVNPGSDIPDGVAQETIPLEPGPVIPSGLGYNNRSFVVGFSVFQGGKWDPLKLGDSVKVNGKLTFAVNSLNSTKEQSLLFAATEDQLTSVSQFSLIPTAPSCIIPQPWCFTPQPSLLLTPLKFNDKSANGFVQIQLLNPSPGFGHSLYAKVVTQVTLENALYLINSAKKPSDDKGEGKGKGKGKGKGDKDNVQTRLKHGLKNHLPTFIKIGLGAVKLGGYIKNLLAKSKKSESENVPDSSKLSKSTALLPLPLPLPNMPFVPQITNLSITYKANHTSVFSEPCKQENYPMAMFHYGSFGTFQVYDANEPPNKLDLERLVPGYYTTVTEAKIHKCHCHIPMFPGSNQGALFLALEKVKAPSILTLLFKLARPSTDSVKDIAAINFCYLNEAGWQPLSVLSNQTSKFGCSGIIEVQLEQDIINASVLMPQVDQNKYCWLSISVDSDTEIFGDVVYVNTQVVNAFRSDVNSLPTGQIPSLPCNKINKTVKSNPALAIVAQPFASTGGHRAENKTDYYHRVSERINDKARSYFPCDYEKMALRACSHLYFARCLNNKPMEALKKQLANHVPANSEAGKLTLLVAKSAADANQVDAFNPQFNRCEINKIFCYIKSRKPAFVNLSVENFQLLPVTIYCNLKFNQQDEEKAAINFVNQRLKVYLSPWIKTEQAQMDTKLGLSKGKLIEFLLSLSQVKTLDSLSISLDTNTALQHIVPRNNQMLVTVEHHQINQKKRAA